MTSKMVQNGNGAGSLEKLERLAAGAPPTVEQICYELSRLFHVRRHEVALLYLERRMLRFLYPMELKSAGAIPLSSSAVAARTASLKRADVFNSFATVQHSSVFETVKLGTAEANEQGDAQVIQKMMSAPVVAANGEVVGVLQISRKGPTVTSAGADFSPDDLATLRRAAILVAKMIPALVEARPAEAAVAGARQIG